VLLPALAGGFFLAVWALLARCFEPYLLPGPLAVVTALAEESGRIVPAAARTAGSALAGFLAASAGGFVISLLLTSSGAVRRAFFPWVTALQMVPVVILVPIILIWLGEGLPSVVAVSFVIGFFPVVANTTMGMASAGREHRDLFAVCRASRWQEIAYLRVPQSLPYFFTGLRVAATLAPIGAITAEILGAADSSSLGLGYLAQIYRSQIRMDALFAVAGVACLLGFLFVGAVRLLAWAVLRDWHESYDEKAR
jgi:NitT/TauT family transport system permease protein